MDLAEEWKAVMNVPVHIGGPAFGSSCEDFTPGLYIKEGFTFTSRGCNGACPWCIVPKVEGHLREIEITPGHIIQDNNFLQTSRAHKDKVFDMLSHQRGICFRGGLESRLVDKHFIEGIHRLRIAELWLACDTPGALPVTVAAIEKLVAAGFSRHKILCYVLIGDDMEENEDRCASLYRAGAMPRAQLYRDFTKTKTEYSKEWRAFEGMWTRPPATIAHMERGTRFEDYHT
jgi:hypothetical protein